MENFTRGPLTIVKCNCGSDFCDTWQIREVGMLCQGSGFKKPDAQLFATAPSMYSQLKFAEKHLRDVITFLKANKEELARLEGEVNALRKLCADKSCNHAWDREWCDDRTGRIYRNCVICGVKVEMP